MVRVHYVEYFPPPLQISSHWYSILIPNSLREKSEEDRMYPRDHKRLPNTKREKKVKVASAADVERSGLRLGKAAAA